MRLLTKTTNLNRGWRSIGGLSVLIPFLALTFYSVIASWSLDYFFASVVGKLENFDAARSTVTFQALLASPWRMLAWHSLFMIITIIIVARGVKRGLEKAVNIMIPALLGILLLLVGFAAIHGDFARGLHFMFYPDFSRLTLGVIFLALGQAFFSLSVGGGFLMTFSAYLSRDVSLPWASVSIGLIDLLIALLAGLAIFPIVFAFGLDVNSGPGLMFETLPVAFGSMSMGHIVGALFFLLLSFAAFTSTISMLEPGVAWFEEWPRMTRGKATILLGFVAWALGIVFILSFNVWQDLRPLAGLPYFGDRNLFGIIELLVANIMLPLNALLIALFAGWMLAVSVTKEELGLRSALVYHVWLWTVRLLAPLAILLVLVTSFQ